MKKSIRNVLCCGALFASLTLSSCGAVNPDDVKSVKVTGGENTVYEYNPYDYDNLKLEVTTNDGRVSIINVTEDMIKQRIDSSSKGNQQLVITYNGKDYKLSVQVKKSPVADNLMPKVQQLITSINEEAKNARSVTFRFKAGAGSTYFDSKMGSNVDGQPLATGEITFTSEQIANGDLTKALALLQLAFGRSDVITEESANGDIVYANLDFAAFMNGLINIGLNNTDYFRGLLVNGDLNVGNWQDTIAEYFNAIYAKTGIQFNPEQIEVALYDAIVSVLKNNVDVSAMGSKLIKEIFTETAIASIANCVGGGIEAVAGIDRLGSTNIIPLLNTIITQVVEIVAPSEAVIGEEDGGEIPAPTLKDNILALGVEIGTAFGADRDQITLALNQLAGVEGGHFVMGVMNVLDSFGVIKVASYEEYVYNDEYGEHYEYREVVDDEKTALVRSAVFNFAEQLDYALDGEPAYVISAYVDFFKTVYGIGKEDDEELGEGEVDVVAEALDIMLDLAQEIDKMFNGEEHSLAQTIVDKVEELDLLYTENFAKMPEEAMMVYSILHEYFVPQVTIENVNSIFETIELMQSIDDPMFQTMVALNGLVNFANTEKTKAFVNYALTGMVAAMLEDDMSYSWSYNRETEDYDRIYDNPFAVYDEEGFLQTYVGEIANLVMDCIYGEADFATTIADIEDIMIENEFEESFYSVQDLVSNIDILIKGFTPNEAGEDLSAAEKQELVSLFINMFDIGFAEDEEELADGAPTKEDLGMRELASYVDDIRAIWLDETGELEVAEKLSMIFNKTEALFDSENIVGRNSNKIAVSFVAGIFNDMLNEEVGKPNIFTNLVNASAKYAYIDIDDPEDVTTYEQEKAFLLKLAYILDNVTELSAEKIAENVAQLVSLPGYVSVVTEMFDIPAYIAVMNKVLVYAAFDVPGVNYNTLMAELNELLPQQYKLSEDWVNVNFNQLVQYIKNMNVADIISVHDVKVDIKQDANGDIIGQTATIMAEFNLDLMVYQANANVSFEIELAY